MKEFEAFLKSASEGEIIEIELRDRETFETLYVKGRLSEDPEKLNSPDRVWISFGEKLGVGKKPWYIEIIEVKEEEVEKVDLETTKVKASLGQRRGSMIKSLLEEREKKGDS